MRPRRRGRGKAEAGTIAGLSAFHDGPAASRRAPPVGRPARTRADHGNHGRTCLILLISSRDLNRAKTRKFLAVHSAFGNPSLVVSGRYS